MNGHTPFALPLQLVTILGLATLGLVMLHALWRPNPRRARTAAAVATGWVVLYACGLLVVSLTSDERILGRGEFKRFCGFYLDCHAMVTVTDVAVLDGIGTGNGRVTPRGRFYVVSVRQASNAVVAPIGIADPVVQVRDAAGRRFGRAIEAERALGTQVGALAPLGRPIEPRVTITTQFVFDLPSDVASPRLHIYEGSMLARLSELFLIGDEDSLLHAPTVFDIAG